MVNNNFSKIKIICYDFDGVMTDNKVYMDENGKEMVQIHRADGLSVSEIKKLGIEQIIISTEKNSVVSLRASKLEIPCLQGIDNKKVTLLEYCENNNIDLQNVAYIGNDLNDKEVMDIAEITFCPADAHDSIKAISDYILKTRGGNGVIRELYDLITAEE